MEERVDSLFYFELGNKLDLERKKLGYSYRYLAELTGISRSQLDRYLSGKQRIKYSAYKVISKALKLDSAINIKISLGNME